MRLWFIVLAVSAIGCSQGSDSGPAPGHDSGTDLGAHPWDGPGQSVSDVAAIDQSPDRSLIIDTGSSLDQGAEPAGGPDLRPELDLAPDLGSASDAAWADNAATDGGCTLVDDIVVAQLPAIDFSSYHSQQQIEDYLQAVAAALPALAQYRVLGQSVQGRDVAYLIINATCQASPPALLANGTHHGDEPSSTEAALAIPDYLLRKSATDPSVRNLLQGVAFYVLPLVNPDGHAAGSRGNADGLDINRDYSYPGRSDADSFKTVEARLIKGLQEAVGFRAAVAYHSGAQEVIWPWCYTGNATADGNFFLATGQKAAAAMNFTIYQQSYDDYPTTGEYIDFAYWRSHTLSATFEVSSDKTPPTTSLASVVDAACRGTIVWAQAASDSNRLHALPAPGGLRKTFPMTAPFNGIDRLE